MRVWRRRGERSNLAVSLERPTARQRGIMVWGAIAHDSTPRLVRIQGTLNAQRYVQNVLRPRLPWPAYSSDLSPIEHVWEVIVRRLQTLPLPRTNDQLWQIVEREWRTIPQDTIRTLIDSVPKRVSSRIAIRGGSTSY
ncbi:transposable element Tcb1 transposase [Trichonephila clavipes]|nr:transposable element Tcb1 transposase [Trichonephila clavipes]